MGKRRDERIHFTRPPIPHPPTYLNRVRARRFPALVNCAAIDVFHPWPRAALVSVAEARFGVVDGVVLCWGGTCTYIYMYVCFLKVDVLGMCAAIGPRLRGRGTCWAGLWVVLLCCVVLCWWSSTCMYVYMCVGGVVPRSTHLHTTPLPQNNNRTNQIQFFKKQRFLDDVNIGLSPPTEAAAPVKKQLAQHMAEEHLSVMRASQVGGVATCIHMCVCVRVFFVMRVSQVG